MSPRRPPECHTRSTHAIITALLALALAMVAATDAAAQDGDAAFGEWRPGAGDKSLAFDLPSGGGTGLALWWHRARGRATGLELSVTGSGSVRLGGATPDRLITATSVAIGPAFKRYRGQLGPVSPYSLFRLGVLAGLQYSDVDQAGSNAQTVWNAGASTGFAFGADWFPLERVSIGGHVGVDVVYRFATSNRADRPDEHTLSLHTRTGQLTLHIYF